jgi:hypothetical protein
MERPETRLIYGHDLDELTEKLNDHMLAVVGLEGFFTRAKLQNLMNGRTKMPDYLKHWKLTRDPMYHKGFW